MHNIVEVGEFVTVHFTDDLAFPFTVHSCVIAKVVGVARQTGQLWIFEVADEFEYKGTIFYVNPCCSKFVGVMSGK